jgi:ribonuclease HI
MSKIMCRANCLAGSQRSLMAAVSEPTNPGGTAGYGAVIFDHEKSPFVLKAAHVMDCHVAPFPEEKKLGARVHEISGMIPPAPTTSNNVAEYLAINAVMDWLIANGHQSESAFVWGDSRLVICQLWGWPVIGKGKWKIHGVDTRDEKPGLYSRYAVAAREKLKLLPQLSGFWIPRDKNFIADELSKAELKRAGVEFRIQPEEEAA